MNLDEKRREFYGHNAISQKGFFIFLRDRSERCEKETMMKDIMAILLRKDHIQWLL